MNVYDVKVACMQGGDVTIVTEPGETDDNQ